MRKRHLLKSFIIATALMATIVTAAAQQKKVNNNFENTSSLSAQSKIEWPGGRYAITSDGNMHDPDDTGAIPMSIALMYLHYKENGEMLLVKFDGIGVGEYDASKGKIEAENYFAAVVVRKKELPNGGFTLANIDNNDYLVYPNIKGLNGKSLIEFKIKALQNSKIEIRKNSPVGNLLATRTVAKTADNKFESVVCDIPALNNTQSVCFDFKGAAGQLILFDSFEIK